MLRFLLRRAAAALVLIWLVATVAFALVSVTAFGQRDVQDFNRDWRFARGEQPEAVRQLDFDDSAWRAARLPHDWAIAGPFDAAAPGATGKHSESPGLTPVCGYPRHIGAYPVLHRLI